MLKPSKTEVVVVCDCGNRDTVHLWQQGDQFPPGKMRYHPLCSNGCGRRMRPMTEWDLEEHQLWKSIGKEDAER